MAAKRKRTFGKNYYRDVPGRLKYAERREISKELREFVALYPPFTHRQTIQLFLAKEVRTDDVEEMLFLGNLRLVLSIANQRYMHSRNVPFEDVFHYGLLGLHRAIEKFDPHRKIHFSTYATFWIKQAISRGYEKEKLIRIPAYLLGHLNPDIPSEDKNKVSEGTIKAARKVKNILSIDEEVSLKGRSKTTLAAILASSENINLNDLPKFETMTNSLSKLEKYVLSCRMGQEMNLEQTAREVYQNLGRKMTRYGVRVVESAALRKLEKTLEKYREDAE